MKAEEKSKIRSNIKKSLQIVEFKIKKNAQNAQQAGSTCEERFQVDNLPKEQVRLMQSTKTS